MDCQRRRWTMSLSTVPPRWTFFWLLALLCTDSFSVTVDMPQIADMSAIGASGFSCEGKVIGGYYADIASGCQMFHVCTLGQEGEIRDIKFLCLAGTVFDQETRVCERVDEVDCANSEAFYNLNLDLYGQHGLILQTGRKVPSGEAGPFTDEQNLQQTDTFYDYQDYDDGLQDPTVSSSNVTSTNDVISSTTEQQITTTEQTTTTTTRLIIPPITEETPPTTINQEAESFVLPNELTPSSTQPSTLDPFIMQLELDARSSQPPPDFLQTPASEIILGPVTASSLARRPDERAASQIAEDEDVLRLLGQIEADVPRIPSKNRNLFAPRIRRNVVTTTTTVQPSLAPRRNRTRRPGGRRPVGSGYSTTLPTAETQTELASPIPVDDKGPFTCTGRITGGFYADISSGCRRFYICGVGKKNRVVSHSFSCGVGLLFDQATLTCQDIDKVDCSVSASFFYLNDPALRPVDPEVKDLFQSLKTKAATEPTS